MDHNQFVTMFGGGAKAGFSAEYAAVMAAMTNKPSGSIMTAQDTMVKALVDAGVWDKLDVLYLFAQESNDDGEALINWINPGANDGTLINAPSFVSLEGFTTDGLTNYINTNWNPTDDGSKFLPASAQISFYEIDNVLASGVAVGSYLSVSNDNACYINVNGSGSLNGRLYEGTAVPGFTTSDSRGLNTLSRTAVDKIEVLRNGVSLDTVVTNSTPDTNSLDFFIGGANDGALDNPTGRQFAMVCMGGGLIESEVLSLYNAIETYMDSNGKGVV